MYNYVLMMGNYEYSECEAHNEAFFRFRDRIITSYHFIDVIEDHTLDIDNPTENILFLDKLKSQINRIYMTHKPEDCIFTLDSKNKLIPDDDGRLTMNLFGHIHEKQKIKRFGINVGVDCNHFYPMSSVEVEFYINAILHHYDENVFM